MRIAIVSETWPPEINGVALTVHGLASGLAARGHRVDVAHPGGHGNARPEPGIDTVCVRGASLPRYPGLRFGFPATRLLARRWRALRPDAVYIATEGPLGWSALRVAQRLGIPTATGFHTRFDNYATHYGLRWLAPWVRAYLRRFHQRANVTLVPTMALADELRGLGIDNVRLLRRAVDTAQFDPRHRDASLRATWGATDDTLVVLYVGRIAPEKNLDLAVRTFRAIALQRPDARFVWVGDGPSRSALETAYPNFLFAGTRLGTDLARHYASADLFVFPSLSETFGNVVLEALASGLPVLAFDDGAAHEHLRDGRNGRRIAVGDCPAFIAAGAAMTAMSSMQGMRDAARASVVALAPGSVVEEFEALLGSLAAAPMPRSGGRTTKPASAHRHVAHAAGVRRARRTAGPA